LIDSATARSQSLRAVVPPAHPASSRRQASTKTSAPVTMSASAVFSLQ
jgi:hypothetical protein